MKKILLFSLCLLFCGITAAVQADDYDAPAQNAIAVEATTGKILYEKEATSPVSIASISKLLTIYLVYDAIKQGKLTMNSQVEISDYAYQLTTNYDISNLPLEQESYSVEELIEASLIANANSAAIALAEKVAGSEKDFVDLMRAKLEEWGITDASIVNATGLNNKLLGEHIYPDSKEDAENQMSAYDAAVVARRLILDFPQVLKITEKTSSTFDGISISNANLMLEDQPNFRSGVDGLKAAYSEQAGLCFVGTTQEKGMRIITVILKAEEGEESSDAHFTATSDLMSYVAQNFVKTTLVEKGESYDKSSVAVVNGKKQQVEAIAGQDLTIIQKIGSEASPKLTFTPNAKSYQAPVAKNKTIGRLSCEDTDLIGQGYLDKNQHSIPMITKRKVERSFFLKVWWNEFVNYVNEKL